MVTLRFNQHSCRTFFVFPAQNYVIVVGETQFEKSK